MVIFGMVEFDGEALGATTKESRVARPDILVYPVPAGRNTGMRE